MDANVATAQTPGKSGTVRGPAVAAALVSANGEGQGTLPRLAREELVGRNHQHDASLAGDHGA
jgi:hypothetical protein